MSKNTSTLPDTEGYLGLMKKRERAAAYPRVSDESLEDSKTLESQEKEIRRYIALKGYELDEEHVYPEAKSAYYLTYRERLQFMRLLDACRRKLIDVVVVSEFSRIARKQHELALLIGLIESYGVRVESCTEVYEKTAVGTFLLAANAFANELEVEKTRHRTTRGKMDRLNDGNLCGSGIPTYGYRFIDTEHETNARYVIYEPEAEVVILIFEKADQGWSVRRIAIYLTEQGIPTAKGLSVWSNQSVDRILKNHAYIGEAIALKWKKDERHKARPRHADEHLQLPSGIIPPIIDVELFERVQRQLCTNKTDSIRSNKHDELGLMRAKKAYCGICGWAMKVKYPRSAYGRQNVPHVPEYYCRIKNGGEGTANNHTVSISLTILDKAAWEYATQFLLNPELVREHIATLRSQTTFESNREAIQEQLKVLKKKISNLVALASDAEDQDTIDDLKGQLHDLEIKKRKAQQYLDHEEQEEEENAKIQQAIDDFEAWAKKVAPRLTDPAHEVSYAERRAAVIAIGIRATVWPKGGEDRVVLEIAPPKIMELMPLIS